MKQTGRLLLGVVGIVAIAGGIYALKGSPAKTATSTGTVQTGAPPAGMMGGPMGGPPGGAAGFAEMQKQHKYAFQLMKLLGSIARLEETKKAPLTPQQAKLFVSVLDPLRKKTTLDEVSARDALKALQGVLSDEQRAAMSALPAERQFRQGPKPGGPPPGGAPSGPPPGAPGGDGMKPPSGFNPLNMPAGGPGGPQGPDRMSKLFDSLKKRAGG